MFKVKTSYKVNELDDEQGYSLLWMLISEGHGQGSIN